MFPLSPRNTGSPDPAPSIMLSCLMGIWKHSSRYWHQPSRWLISTLLTIMVSASRQRRRVIMSKSVLGLFAFPENQYNISWSQGGKNIWFECHQKRKSMWVLLCWQKRKPSFFLKKKKKKSHNLCKKEKSYVIKCFVFTRANEMAQNTFLKSIIRVALGAQQEFWFPLTCGIHYIG